MFDSSRTYVSARQGARHVLRLCGFPRKRERERAAPASEIAAARGWLRSIPLPIERNPLCAYHDMPWIFPELLHGFRCIVRAVVQVAALCWLRANRHCKPSAAPCAFAAKRQRTQRTFVSRCSVRTCARFYKACL